MHAVVDKHHCMGILKPSLDVCVRENNNNNNNNNNNDNNNTLLSTEFNILHVH